MSQYSFDICTLDVGCFDILDENGDPIATINDGVDAENLANHLNHPRGKYQVVEHPNEANLRFAIVDPDGDTIAFVRILETAEGLLTHLNRDC